MAQLRLALAQVDLTVGDLPGNAERIVEWSQRAADRGAHVVAFPEMALTGYPVEDLALRTAFVEGSRQALRALARRLDDEGLGDLAVLCGYLERAYEADGQRGRPGGLPQNALAVLHRGKVALRTAKHHLPNYGVFDEYRYFVPGERLGVVRVHGVDIALAICEDLWQEGGPVAAARGAGLLLVVNASPYEVAKDDVRLETCARRARDAGCPLAYVNLVGGQDELVFDGDSLVVDADGDLVARAPQFAEELLVVDLDLTAAGEHGDREAPSRPVTHAVLQAKPLPPYRPVASSVAERLDDEAEIYQALVAGLRDYVSKNGFASVLVGLSGGIDSALTATVACDALGAEQVHGFSMPSRYSTTHSRDDAAELAERTGLRYQVIEIAAMVEAYVNRLDLTGIAEENVQARVRGTTLMALSNLHGHLVLATGNKSELAVGYSTMYGDSVGGYAPLKDVPKTLVWRLARWRNKHAEESAQVPPIPEATISKPPSAELRPDQLDTDSLPDYEVLDLILDQYVDRDLGSAELVAAGFERSLVKRVVRLVDSAEYKRRQYPPGPKISFRAFGRDRRLPITNRWREET